MKTFWNDYKGLCKETGRFYKKHWKGVVALNVVTYVATIAWYGRDAIKDMIEEKFSKKDKDESQ